MNRFLSGTDLSTGMGRNNKSIAIIIAIILALSSIALVTNTVKAVEIVKSIPHNGPSVMAYDSYKGAVWVTTYYSYPNELGMPISKSTNTVSAISTSNYKVLANVTVGKNPSGIAYASALHEIYVVSQVSGTISVISDASNSVVATIDLNKNSSNGDRVIGFIVYDSGRGEIFVGSYDYSTLTAEVLVISETTKQVVATIPLGDGPPPTRLIYDSGKGEIYVYRERNRPGENPIHFLSVISDVTNSVIATVPLDSGIGAAGAYDAATGEIYLPSNRSVLVISDKTHTVVDSIPLEYNLFCVAYDPVKSVLFAGTGYGPNTIYIISDRTRSVIETVPISGVSMDYDTGKNLMLVMGNSSLHFVSDDSLPSASEEPSVPEFPATLAIIFLLITAIAVSIVLKKFANKHAFLMRQF